MGNRIRAIKRRKVNDKKLQNKQKHTEVKGTKQQLKKKEGKVDKMGAVFDAGSSAARRLGT